ncbi:MAG: DoxX family protein [Nonlabens sp.]
MNLLKACILISSISFIAYVISYFVMPKMKSEFKRFGLAKFGLPVIILQFLGAFGLIAGMWYRPLLLVASGGLTLLMVLGVYTRFRVKDPFLIALPAIIFTLLNAYIFYRVLTDTAQQYTL